MVTITPPIRNTKTPACKTEGKAKTMTVRTITGNLASDPEVVPAGKITITKFRVIDNTGEYRGGTWVEHDNATTHFVEARFELGDNTAVSLHKGDAVIVIGREHTEVWGDEGNRHYGRVVEAEHIGPNLIRSVARVRRTNKPDDED
jgi:single-strand DNA-binding protein